MDTGDFTAPKTPFKAEGDRENDGSGLSTSESESVSDSDGVSETYSVLMAELHKEIDKCGILHKKELQEFLCSKLKPLLNKLVSGMSRVHHLSEQLQVALELTGTASPEKEKDPLDRKAKVCVPSLKDILSKIGFEKSMDDLQNYLISSDRTCLLSDLEALRMELRDCQNRHQATAQGLHQSLHCTEEHYKALIARLQQGLQSSEAQVQCLQQLLGASEENVEALRCSLHTSHEESQSLRRDLCSSSERLRALKQELSSHKSHVQALKQMLQASEENVQLLRRNLRASEELCHSLRQRLLTSEQKAQGLQEAAELWEGQAKNADAQRELREKELEAKHEQEMKKITKAFRSSKEKLDSQQQEAQRSLEKAAVTEKSLRKALVTEQTQHHRTVEQLQEEADKVKEDKAKVEQTLHGQIISLKNQLVEEICKANKMLEGSTKYEKKLQDTITDLRETLRQQKEGPDLALDCLRRRHHDVTIVQRLLEANIQYCSQASVRAETRALLKAQSGLPQPQELQQDLQEVTTQMHSALQNHHEVGQGREEWEEVLRRAEEWQREAERLVNSLDYVRMDTTLKGKKRDAKDANSPHAGLLPRPCSTGTASQRPVTMEGCCSAETNIESLAAVQRRLRNLQSVHFQKSLKEFLRMP